MTPSTLRGWSWAHKWSSLVSTIFMLLLCLTGLPLIFHHEIGHLLGTEVEAPEMPADTPKASIDKVLDAARGAYPNKPILFLSREPDDDSTWFVTLADHLKEQEKFDSVVVDSRTAEVLGTPNFNEGFMHWMFRLHVDLFAGLPGMLFLGFMGLLLVIAIVSGVVLYAPFMRKLDFGTVRQERSTRLKWLDLHNLLGIVTMAWALVVGLTGIINTLAQPAFGYWQQNDLAPFVAQYQGKGEPPAGALSSLQQSVNAAQELDARKTLRFVAFPGTNFSSPYHYALYMQGDTPLTSRIFTPVLVDAQSSKVSATLPLPWYLTTLFVSQPLHFGDYGGMPLQIIWAVLDIITIIVLGSGLYLWLRKPKGARKKAGKTSDVESALEEAGGELEGELALAKRPVENAVANPALGHMTQERST